MRTLQPHTSIAYEIYADIQQIRVIPSNNALDQVFYTGCSPQLVRKMLTVL